MIVGAFLALRQTDLKLILAYLTVSALGISGSLFGVGTSEAIIAAIVFLLGHALYKGALFLVVGNIDHETGSRDAGKLSGLRSAMPVTATIARVGGALTGRIPANFGIYRQGGIARSLARRRQAEQVITHPRALCSRASSLSPGAGIIAIQPFFGKKSETRSAATRSSSAVYGFGPCCWPL